MNRRTEAFTLLEMVIVLAILVATAGILTPLYTGTLQDANQVATERSLNTIRDAVLYYWADTKLLPMDGILTVATEADRLSVDWLFINPSSGDTVADFAPSTKIGWRGRYLTDSTGDPVAAGKSLIVDAWNNEVTTQLVSPTADPRDLRIVSAGPNGVIDIPPAVASAALTSGQVGDDLYVALSLR